jgi:hypothetical protein
VELSTFGHSLQEVPSPSAVREHSRPLAEYPNLAGSPPDCFRENSTRTNVVGDERDQLLNAVVVVIPHLDPMDRAKRAGRARRCAHPVGAFAVKAPSLVVLRLGGFSPFYGLLHARHLRPDGLRHVTTHLS